MTVLIEYARGPNIWTNVSMGPPSETTQKGPKVSGLTNYLRWHKKTTTSTSASSILEHIAPETDTLTSPQMALYIPRSVFHLARLLNVRPETFGPSLLIVRFLKELTVVYRNKNFIFMFSRTRYWCSFRSRCIQSTICNSVSLK